MHMGGPQKKKTATWLELWLNRPKKTPRRFSEESHHPAQIQFHRGFWSKIETNKTCYIYNTYATCIIRAVKACIQLLAYKYSNIYTHTVYATPIPKIPAVLIIHVPHPCKYCPFLFQFPKAPTVAFDISSSTVGGHRGNGSEPSLASLSLLSGSPRCHPCDPMRDNHLWHTKKQSVVLQRPWQVANCYLVVSSGEYTS